MNRSDAAESDILNETSAVPQIITRKFGSPFNYKKQSLLCIPTDVPYPGDRLFEPEISNFIADLITITSGRAMILFTSFKMLNYVAELVEKKLTEICRKISEPPFDFFIQGKDDRHRLLSKFRQSKRGILFGTSSFWEGIDVQGQALSLLIVAKLPFPAPDDPLIEAKCEACEKNMENSFNEVILPEAVIKLKQGFGRLIRSSSDYGAAVLLDKRIISRNYGRFFLNSIPECTKITGGKEQLIDRLIDFFIS
jgi:ATP-dependent DNA helicase DinG